MRIIHTVTRVILDLNGGFENDKAFFGGVREQT